jgi:hypothetical protein
LSLFDSDTYLLLDIFWLDIPATRAATELLKRPAGEAAGLKQSLEACRNDVEARFDIVVIDGMESDKISRR